MPAQKVAPLLSDVVPLGLTALLLWASYPPVDAGWLAWISLVPFWWRLGATGFGPCLRHLRGLSLRWTCTVGCLYGFASCFWLRHVTWMGLFILALYLGLYWLLFAWLCGPVVRRHPACALVLAPAWVGLDYLRSTLLTGLPWFLLGHTQYRFLPVLQLAELGGVSLVGLLVALSNASLAWFLLEASRNSLRDALRSSFWIRSKPALAGIAGFLAFLGASVAYGRAALGVRVEPPGPRVQIVQANIPQSAKNFALSEIEFEKLSREILEKHIRLSREHSGQRDLVVWAETMYLPTVAEGSPGLAMLGRIAQRLECPMVVGTFRDEADASGKPAGFYNSAVVVGADGELRGHYDKVHLVIGAEYLPGRDALPILKTLLSWVTSITVLGELTPGKGFALFRLGEYQMAPLICYDSCYSDVARQACLGGANILLTLSNDGWYLDSAELDQIHAIAVFRCVENRIGMVRVTNTGISSVIEPSGRFELMRGADGRTKEVEGTWVRCPKVRTAVTPFTRYGEWAGTLSALAVLGVAAARFLPLLGQAPPFWRVKG